MRRSTTTKPISLLRKYNRRIQSAIKIRWYGMHHRVEHHPNYILITICKEWHKSNPNGFENFYHWSLDNDFQDNPNIVLDKDFKMWKLGKNSYEYSPATCSYIGRLLNGRIGGFEYFNLSILVA